MNDKESKIGSKEQTLNEMSCNEEVNKILERIIVGLELGERRKRDGGRGSHTRDRDQLNFYKRFITLYPSLTLGRERERRGQ